MTQAPKPYIVIAKDGHAPLNKLESERCGALANEAIGRTGSAIAGVK